MVDKNMLEDIARESINRKDPGALLDLLDIKIEGS